MAIRRDPFDWNDIPILVALARGGSMRAAGRSLGVTTSTISRRLAAAEKALQTRLFVRAPDGYKPTDVGKAFLVDAEAIGGRMHALLSNTHQEAQTVKGTVRITSVDAVLNDWLIPRLPELRSLHPELEIKLVADNQVLSFARGESDLALRVARPREDAAILMRRIATVGMGVYAARSFRRTARNRWGRLPWLAFNDDLSASLEMQWLAEHVPDARPMFRCSSMSALIRACESGLGLALLPCFAADPSKLIRLGAGPVLHRDIYLLSHRQTGRIRRFRAVAEWIAGIAADDAVRLSGSFRSDVSR